jgi:hypothetical protein
MRIWLVTAFPFWRNGVAQAQLKVHALHPDADGTPSDKVEYISYLHISSVETLSGVAQR